MRWTLKPKQDKEQVASLAKQLNIDEILASLLVQRGIDDFDAAKHFFRPSLDDLHDPFLLKDMDLAVARIELAIANEENILVYGDYDVDGTTSVALVSSYLLTRYPNVASYIPDRYAEGYGVSFKGIDFADDNDFSLIISLDCGIKAIDKVAYATDKGIDFIICDHHRPGAELPKAIAILDAKRDDCSYPYDELCGCGVGFKLIQALGSRNGETIEDHIPYLDLVATAIGADIVPITGENRILAYHGLKVINTFPRAGMKAMIDQKKRKELSITDVVFGIAPRINAAGRMKHGAYAVNLLTETDYEKAQVFAEEINEFNIARREKDQEITVEALAQIEELGEQERFTTVVYDANWHKGVIGIVASRLIENYYRPTLVFTKSGDKLAASARSVKGFDVYEALAACSEYIEQFGGHKYAAGLTLSEEHYPLFKAKFEEVVASTIDKRLLVEEITIDTELDFTNITPRFYRILKQFAPFGPDNMTPAFLTKGLKDTGYAKGVGQEEKHLKCALKKGNQTISAIGFGLGDKLALLKDNTVDVIYGLDENEWNGNVTLQLMLKDLK